ncbi:hypothetical protein EK904_015078, partial [Melospiza melodia maxima]
IWMKLPRNCCNSKRKHSCQSRKVRRSGEAAPIGDLRGVTPACARTALRCPSDSSQLPPAPPAAAPPFWPDGQHSSDLGSGGPGSGQKAAFYSRPAGLRLTPTHCAAEHSAAAGTRAPARRCPWRRCPRSCCCCCCPRPVSRAGPGPGLGTRTVLPARAAAAGSAGCAALVGPGRMGMAGGKRGTERSVRTNTPGRCLCSRESSPCDRGPALGHSGVGLAQGKPRAWLRSDSSESGTSVTHSVGSEQHGKCNLPVSQLVQISKGTVEGRVRSRRGILELAGAIRCSTGRSPFAYLRYGCYCGLGGKGWPMDRVDWCCFNHDCCYGRAEQAGCQPKTESYHWECKDNSAVCDSLEDKCQKMACECDREAAKCFSKAPYHRKYLLWPDFLC